MWNTPTAALSERMAEGGRRARWLLGVGLATGLIGRSALAINFMWTWVGGTNEPNQAGVYGTKGLATPGNRPGTRDAGMAWSKQQLWLFGGYGMDWIGNQGELSDLWRYDGTNWAWYSGTNVIDRRGVYGIKGEGSDTNLPGARYDGATWVGELGQLWLFGGWGRDRAGTDGMLNDLWRFDDPSWTWVSGSNVVNCYGIYGAKGVAAPSNAPGARFGGMAWTNRQGRLVLFGGYGRGSVGEGCLNDGWEFDGADWTWVGGSNTVNQPGIYGTRGVAAPANLPGGRYAGAVCGGKDGCVWLFGGHGLDAAGNQGRLCDLWKHDGTNWTWFAGTNSFNQTGRYGTLGTPSPGNQPGGRYYSKMWCDSRGHLWLTGGSGLDGAGQSGKLNDLWEYDGTNWTWTGGSNRVDLAGDYGARGVIAPANLPGARHRSTSWTDSRGRFWLFGGEGMAGPVHGYLGDFWRLAPVAEITVTSGAHGAISPSGLVYAVSGDSPSFAITPDTYYAVADVVADGVPTGSVTAFTFENVSAGTHSLGATFKVDVPITAEASNRWTWMGGSNTVDQRGVYGALGQPAAENLPGARYDSLLWRAGGDAPVWLFGGYGYGAISGPGLLNDFWRLAHGQWAWIGGSNTLNQWGLYGTRGVAAPGNLPGARQGGVTWAGSDGHLWLFGGHGRDANGSAGQMNDLWEYDGSNWAWRAGTSVVYQAGTYGAKGTPAPTNTPGARYGAMAWLGGDGHLWLFGGDGRDAIGSSGYLNDLWAYDGTNWTWLGGSNRVSQAGMYQTKGAFAPANLPGGRRSGAGCRDRQGWFWLFGGYGSGAVWGDGYLNDLWAYDGTNWMWASGSNRVDCVGAYGPQGALVPGSMPGGRDRARLWADGDGRLWLCGGHGRGASDAIGSLNDLWMYDGTNWAWIAGSNGLNQAGSYGVPGVPGADRVPGARQLAEGWTDAAGALWLLGGLGRDAGGAEGCLNDLWRFAAIVELSATAGVHGAVSPSGTVYVARGAHQPFTATPDAYYHTDQILTNGAAAVTNLGSGASVYVWSNVTVAGVLRAHFGENLAPQGTPEWWLALYGLTNSGLTFTEAETNDVDHDGHTAGQERVADTDPTNAASRFRVVAISNLPPLRVFFGTSTSRVYELEWRGDLATSGWAVVGDQTNRAGSGGTLSLSDTNAPSPRRFYRVGVGY